MDRFILFWGEMASNWGINRTMAQIHALLYASAEPLDTDTIMERLGVSRGNANMNLRSLLNWDLVRKVNMPGSRKDYYVAESDVWQIMSRIIEERRQREIVPVMDQLKDCRSMLLGPDAADGPASLEGEEQVFYERLERLQEMMVVFQGFSEALIPLLQRENAPLIAEFVRLARSMEAASGRD
jgi:DNA-binding transcriptional regulator GbsR (MarR family)